MRLLEDRRLGGELRYVLTDAERLMLVPDEVRKCVGFVAYDNGRGQPLCGTAFVASLPLVESKSARFAITAAHVLDEISKRTVNGKVLLRFNARGGGFIWIETHLDQWLRHPTDAAIDCAVIPLPVPKQADVLAFPLDGTYLTDETVAKLGIGAGDEVFFPGLFIHHSGKNQNIPIIRGGTIAAMPGEPIATERGPMPGYLIEARSIGGLSGSPAFVQIPRPQEWEKQPDGLKRIAPFFFFMGVIHGHWPVGPLADAVTEDSLREEVVNMGVAIVLPAPSVMETLEQPALQALMEGWRQEVQSATSPTPDVAS